MKGRALLLDLDGVLVKDKALNPFPDSVSFLQSLRESGISFRVVSNNSTRPPEELLKELCSKGLYLRDDEFVSPLSVLGDRLNKMNIHRIFFIGMPAVRNYLQTMGFEVVDDHRVDGVVIGQDRNLDMKKLKIATSAVFLSGARIIPINLSRIVRDDDGFYFPGSGSIALCLAHACNYGEKLPNLGKPSADFIEFALRGFDAEEVYLVSDDVYTDLIGAKELGLKTVFMTTGKYGREETQRANFEPDLTFDSLTELLDYLYKAVFP